MHCSWGGGGAPWGPEKDDKFSQPNHWDGMLEVLGVTGVVHLGQIQSGLRSAIRLVQASQVAVEVTQFQIGGYPMRPKKCSQNMFKK